MKIMNITSGKPYQLAPDTVVEVERTNPFFNEYGEQTLPVTLPASDYNRNILKYQDDISAGIKQQANIEASIEDQDFFMVCRQAILSSQRRGNISTTFYMNEGAFYSQLSDINLKDVFGTETIPDIATVDEGIAFCRSLVDGSNAHFAIFPVLIDNSSTTSVISGISNVFIQAGYKYLNRYGYTENSVFYDGMSSSSDFYNAVERTETTDDQTTYLDKGYYMSPFIRANYLLERIFAYLGYTLDDSFFTKTSPFSSMVFLNNTMDSLANGDIRIADLVPDSTLSTILDVIRKKFCCEFIPDETHKTMGIKLFNEVVEDTPEFDVTSYMTSEPEITYPEKYMQMKIGSEDKVTDDLTVSDVASLVSFTSKYPNSYLNKNNGCWYHIGYQGDYQVYEKVMNCTESYYESTVLKVNEVSVPDKALATRLYSDFTDMPDVYGKFRKSALYIGESQALNSTLKTTSTSGDTTTASSNTTSDQKPMLAFACNLSDGFPHGTCTNYYGGTKLFDYSLYYNGPDGIFEKFWRAYDNFLRNSKHTLKVNLLLPNELKMNLKAHKLLEMKGQRLFINDLKFDIGNKNSPVESEFYTVKNHTPSTTAKAYDEIINNNLSGYKWEHHYNYEIITQSVYEANKASDTSFKVIFPPAITSKYVVGIKYFEQNIYIATSGGTGVGTGFGDTYQKRVSWYEVVAS